MEKISIWVLNNNNENNNQYAIFYKYCYIDIDILKSDTSIKAVIPKNAKINYCLIPQSQQFYQISDIIIISLQNIVKLDDKLSLQQKIQQCSCIILNIQDTEQISNDIKYIDKNIVNKLLQKANREDVIRFLENQQIQSINNKNTQNFKYLCQAFIDSRQEQQNFIDVLENYQYDLNLILLAYYINQDEYTCLCCNDNMGFIILNCSKTNIQLIREYEIPFKQYSYLFDQNYPGSITFKLQINSCQSPLSYNDQNCSQSFKQILKYFVSNFDNNIYNQTCNLLNEIRRNMNIQINKNYDQFQNCEKQLKEYQTYEILNMFLKQRQSEYLQKLLRIQGNRTESDKYNILLTELKQRCQVQQHEHIQSIFFSFNIQPQILNQQDQKLLQTLNFKKQIQNICIFLDRTHFVPIKLQIETEKIEIYNFKSLSPYNIQKINQHLKRYNQQYYDYYPLQYDQLTIQLDTQQVYKANILIFQTQNDNQQILEQFQKSIEKIIQQEFQHQYFINLTFKFQNIDINNILLQQKLDYFTKTGQIYDIQTNRLQLPSNHFIIDELITQISQSNLIQKIQQKTGKNPEEEIYKQKIDLNSLIRQINFPLSHNNLYEQQKYKLILKDYNYENTNFNTNNIQTLKNKVLYYDISKQFQQLEQNKIEMNKNSWLMNQGITLENERIRVNNELEFYALNEYNTVYDYLQEIYDKVEDKVEVDYIDILNQLINDYKNKLKQLKSKLFNKETKIKSTLEHLISPFTNEIIKQQQQYKQLCDLLVDINNCLNYSIDLQKKQTQFEINQKYLINQIECFNLKLQKKQKQQEQQQDVKNQYQYKTLDQNLIPLNNKQIRKNTNIK